MPQGWITRVEKDMGWVSRDGGKTERAFRHWALAAEMGGRFPKVGDYVQYRELSDPSRGAYLTEVRTLTPPQVRPVQQVYQNDPQQAAGIKRVVDGQRVPLEQALTEEPPTGIRRVVTPPVFQHRPVDLTMPTDPTVVNDGHTVTVTTATVTTTTATPPTLVVVEDRS